MQSSEEVGVVVAIHTDTPSGMSGEAITTQLEPPTRSRSSTSSSGGEETTITGTNTMNSTTTVLMRDRRLDFSPERARRRCVSPSNSYSDTTAAIIEPISPKQQGQRTSLRLDEATYNLLTGNIALPSMTTSTGANKTTRNSPTRMGSCPNLKLAVQDLHVSDRGNQSKGQLLFSTPPPRSTAAPVDSSERKEGEEKSADQESDGLASIVAGGVVYYPEEVLAEGWLQKKGTGHDWLGSRGWKARWARLCMATTKPADSSHGDSQTQTNVSRERPTSPEPFMPQTPFLQQHSATNSESPIVPILLLYWFPYSTTVSTAILLDSTVVMGVDLEDKTRVNPYRFEVRHATTQENVTLPTITRTFAAPRRERDAWVYAISQALLTYGKAKQKARKEQKAMIMSHRISPRGVVLGAEDECPWRSMSPLSDRGAATIAREKSAAPPLSPTMPTRRLSLQRPSPPTRSSSTPSILSESSEK